MIGTTGLSEFLDHFKKSDSMYKKIIGIAATIIGISSAIPIVINIHKTGKAQDFTILNLGLALISNLLWIIYGFIGNSFSTKLMGSLFFSMYGYILSVKLRNMR